MHPNLKASSNFSERLVTISMISMSLCGCSMDHKNSKVSNDAGALRKVVDIPTNVKSARWEIFGTPEYAGGVPGPTDYVTLVAELEPNGSLKNLPVDTGDGTVYIVPESARPWMSRDFRSLLEKSKNSALDLATVKECHAYATRLVRTGDPVRGFMCAKPGRVLLYLSLL
jgi:hypothetical protein